MKIHIARFAGTASLFQTFCKKSNNNSLATTEFCHTSVGISSDPGAFAFFILLSTDLSNSSLVNIALSSSESDSSSKADRAFSSSVGVNLSARNSCHTPASSSGSNTCFCLRFWTHLDRTCFFAICYVVIFRNRLRMCILIGRFGARQLFAFFL